MIKLPVSLVVVEELILVPTFVIVTLAPSRELPKLSVTFPLKSEVVSIDKRKLLTKIKVKNLKNL
jgi:hypothetical protein